MDIDGHDGVRTERSHLGLVVDPSSAARQPDANQLIRLKNYLTLLGQLVKELPSFILPALHDAHPLLIPRSSNGSPVRKQEVTESRFGMQIRTA